MTTAVSAPRPVTRRTAKACDSRTCAGDETSHASRHPESARTPAASPHSAPTSPGRVGNAHREEARDQKDRAAIIIGHPRTRAEAERQPGRHLVRLDGVGDHRYEDDEQRCAGERRDEKAATRARPGTACRSATARTIRPIPTRSPTSPNWPAIPADRSRGGRIERRVERGGDRDRHEQQHAAAGREQRAHRLHVARDDVADAPPRVRPRFTHQTLLRRRATGDADGCRRGSIAAWPRPARCRAAPRSRGS